MSNGWAILGLAVAALFWGAWLVRWLHGHGIRPLREVVGLVRKPWFEFAFLMFCICGLVQHGATKGTNGTDGVSGPMPPRMMMGFAPTIVPEVGGLEDFAMPTNLPAVTNLCFWGIERSQNLVTLGIAWPSGFSFVNDCIDLYGNWRLATNGWLHIAQIDVSGASSNAVVRLAAEDFPTNAMESSAFYCAADQTDSDDDGLSDAFERMVSGSSPTCADTDDDGIDDGDEAALGTNLNAADTDGDGITDGDEAALGTDPIAADTDGDGITDKEEIGSVEVTQVDVSQYYGSLIGSHVWSLNANYDYGSCIIPLPQPWTVNGTTYTQAAICVDGIIYLLDPEHPNHGYSSRIYSPPSLASYLSDCHVAIAGFGDNLYVDAAGWASQAMYGTIDFDGSPASIIDFYNIGFSDDNRTGEQHFLSYQLILPSAETNVFYLMYKQLSGSSFDQLPPSQFFVGRNPTIGVQCPWLPSFCSGEQCYNLTWEPPAGAFDTYLLLKFTIGSGTNPRSADSDGDGFSDYDEIHLFKTNPNEADADDDSDGVPDAAESRLGLDLNSADTDRDGLTDLEELTIGTNPSQPDTDGDGMDDGWEWTYCNRSENHQFISGGNEPTSDFDPTVDNSTDADPNNDLDADPDVDGMLNEEECENRTNPTNPDTDGDFVTDGNEIVQSSDPSDATDGGRPNSRVSVQFTFGDPSESHSEKYRLEIIPMSGYGEQPMSFSWLNANYGVCETRTARLKSGWRYEVRLTWAACNHASDGSYYPNYDYTLSLGQNIPQNVAIDDPGSIFRSGYYGGEYYGASHFPVLDAVATISVYEVTKVSICKPSGQSWDELEESRVVLDDEALRIKVEIVPQVRSLAQCRQMFGDALIVKTSGTCPSGVSVPIGNDATMNNSAGTSEIRISKTRQQLGSLGLLPSQDEDGVDEMVWLDMASGTGQSLADSEAFAGLGFADRGTSCSDASKTLMSTPPNSIPSESYFKAAGREIVTATYGGVTSDARQLMNQADVLYFSGHGNHDSNSIQGKFTPTMAKGYWNRDLDIAIIAGCSVLDINDYNWNYSGAAHLISPGEVWERIGPSILLGYAYIAPGDAGGAPTRIINHWRANRAASGDVNAWMDANATYKAWNACAIVKNVCYVYFKKQLFRRYKQKTILKKDW